MNVRMWQQVIEILRAGNSIGMSIGLCCPRHEEISLEASKPEDVLLACTFTMVALDPNTRKPVHIPKLLYTTPEEERIFKNGEAMSLAKKEELKASLLQTEPNDAESALIHRIWLRQLTYHDPSNSLRQPKNVVAMSKAG